MTTIQTLDDLHAKGYRLRRTAELTRNGKGDPVGVALFEKAGAFFESVMFERFGRLVYATPEKLGER